MARRLTPFSERSLDQWKIALQRDAAPDERYRALLAIKLLGTHDDLVEWCRHSFNDADAAIRALAAKLIGDLKRETNCDKIPWSDLAEKLITQLSDSDHNACFEAARALGAIRPEATAARDVLLSLLGLEGIQPLTLASLISAIAERTDVDPKFVVDRFGALLNHQQSEVRENVSAAIANWGGHASLLVDPLVIALEDEEPLVRENAALALGRAGNNSTQVLDSLTSATADEDEVVARTAQQAIDQLRAKTS